MIQRFHFQDNDIDEKVQKEEYNNSISILDELNEVWNIRTIASR